MLVRKDVVVLQTCKENGFCLFFFESELTRHPSPFCIFFFSFFYYFILYRFFFEVESTLQDAKNRFFSQNMSKNKFTKEKFFYSGTTHIDVLQRRTAFEASAKPANQNDRDETTL
jgi:hypothetical protein